MVVTQLTDQLWWVEPVFGQCWIWCDGDEGAVVELAIHRARAGAHALDVDVACFGHGEPLVGAAGARLRIITDLGPFA